MSITRIHNRELPESYDAPELLHCYFSKLDLKDLLIMKRVCSLWNGVIDDHAEFWKQISLRKGIFLEKVLPKDYQKTVLASLKPYNQAAREIFIEMIVPGNEDPRLERALIDNEIHAMDRSTTDLQKRLLEECKHTSRHPNDTIPKVQVLLQAGAVIGGMAEGIPHYNGAKWQQKVVTPEVYPSFREFYLDQLKLIDYLVCFGKPTTKILGNTCFAHALIEWQRVCQSIWELLNIRENEVPENIMQQMREAEETGEILDAHMLPIMEREKVDPNLTLLFPDYLAQLIKNLSEAEYVELKESYSRIINSPIYKQFSLFLIPVHIFNAMPELKFISHRMKSSWTEALDKCRYQ